MVADYTERESALKARVVEWLAVYDAAFEASFG
jgi:hypothetical protein